MKAAETIMSSVITKVVLGAVIILLVYMLIVRPIMKKLGIIEDKDDKARDKQVQEFGTELGSPFNPNFYKGKVGVTLLTKAAATKLANQIEAAIGFFSDDENAVYGAMRQLKTKEQLSFLADIFQQEHNADLYQMLVRNLSETEMDVVNGIAKNLK
ncbi:MAG: hypothetical protein WAU36_10335 [Cyclobacteriaceae bacterium]